MRRFAAVLIGIAVLGGALANATEIRLLGNRDLSWGSGTWVSTGLATVYRINADILPFSEDNAVKVGVLYPYALALDNGTIAYCMKWSSAGVVYWGTCGTGGSTTSLPWDNITGTDDAITSAKILDNSVKNIDVASDAAIDATKIADGTVTNTEFQYLGGTSSAIQDQFDAKAPLVSPTLTTPTLGVAAATSINTGQGANALYGMDQEVKTTSDVVFNSVTTPEWITTCIASDNACGIGLGNQTDPAGQYLDAAYLWFNVTSNMVKVRNGDNNATLEVMTSGAAHTLAFATTGTLSGGIVILDNVASPSAAQTYGSLNIVNAAITVTLPAAASGMSTCVLSVAAAAVSVDVDGSDVIYLNGTALSAGDKITSASAAGDFICLVSSGTVNWYTLGRSGTWTDGN